MNNYIAGGILLLGLFLSSSAQAVLVTLDPGAVTGADGTEFDVTIGIDGQTESITSYSVSLSYDPTELAFVSAQEFKPTGFSTTLAPFPTDEGGTVESWGASTLFDPGVSGTFDIGTVTFRIIGQGTGDGGDILAGLFNAGVDGISDANLDVIPEGNITFGQVAVNAIPEPASWLLIGSGLIGLLGLRRR